MSNKNIRIERRIVTFILLILFVFIIIRLLPLFTQITTEERKSFI